MKINVLFQIYMKDYFFTDFSVSGNIYILYIYTKTDIISFLKGVMLF